MSRSYSKTPTSVDQQIHLLLNRGLIIRDRNIAEKYLSSIGYYRLSGYWHIFQKDKIKHTFFDQTTFDDIISVYRFDRGLRLLLFDAIERIEVALKSFMTNNLCLQHGSTWFASKEICFSESFYKDNLKDIDRVLNRSNEDFINHYRNKYEEAAYPPSWITMEILSLGTVSKLYSNISANIEAKKIIALQLGLPTAKHLQSWLQSIAIVRNYCAHHSRIWNRKFVDPPLTYSKSKHPWIIQQPTNESNKLLYYRCCIIKYLSDRIDPTNTVAFKLKELFKKHSIINKRIMGFPDEWIDEELWK